MKRMILLFAILLLVIAAVTVAAKTFIFPKPVITINGDKEQTLEVFSPYEEQGAKAKLGLNDISDRLKIEGEVNTDVPGDYEVSYGVTYKEKDYVKKRVVHVRDTQPPVLELTDGDKEVNASSIDTFKDPGYTATDNFDGNITSQVDVVKTPKDENSFTVTYQVWDQAGNKATAERNVIIKDTFPPEITLKGEAEMSLSVGEEYEEPGATAVDDLDGDITASMTVEGTVDTSKEGEYTVTYTATDAAGNVGTATRTVKVAAGDTAQEGDSVIYLTFDDGPSTKVTEEVLDVLKENNVTATFFIINYEDSSIPILQRMVDEGHTIGIHAYSHDYEECYKTDDAYLDGVHKMIEKVKEDVGYEAFCCRFPGGSSNTVSKKYNEGVMTRLTQMVEADGLQYYDWNVDSTDAEGNNRPVDTLVNSVISGLQKGRGNIVLCHDTNAKETTAQALQRIIDYGKENGYTFSAIKKNTAPVHHGVNN